MRVFDGTENAKEGWVPADVLDTQHTEQSIYGDKADDAAYRREYEGDAWLVDVKNLTF